MAPLQADRRYWVAGALCSVLPDIDAIGRRFGGADLAFLGGHRGLTHSLLFAGFLGFVVAWTGFRAQRWNLSRTRIAAFLIFATASHGALDAFASYGEGIAFFLPFSDARYAAPWQPFTGLNEIWWLWLPAALLIAVTWQVRRHRRRTAVVNAAV